MSEVKLLTLNGLPLEGDRRLIPSRTTADGTAGKLWLDRDGAVITKSWKQALLDAGRCFTFTVGTLSTAIVGGGNGTVLDLDQPEALLSVPAGKAIKLLRVAVQTNGPAAITDNDITQILLCLDNASAWNKDGTYTTEVAYNMNTGSSQASGCFCASAFTADMLASSGNDTVHYIDLARVETKAEVAANGTAIAQAAMLYEPDPCPTIVGPALVTLYWGGTAAVSGYAQIFWAEFTKDEVT
jgi:hypothetical protein